MRTPQLRAAVALAVAVTPCWLLLDDAPFMWTDVAEFSERARLLPSAASAWRSSSKYAARFCRPELPLRRGEDLAAPQAAACRS